MQNIDFGPKKIEPKTNDSNMNDLTQKTKPDDGAMNMSVSPVCTKDGKQFAFVTFDDGSRNAEGEIPNCHIIRNNGFSEDEVVGLEIYMKANLTMLKKMAAGVNVLDAFMGKTNQPEK